VTQAFLPVLPGAMDKEQAGMPLSRHLIPCSLAKAFLSAGLSQAS
jgi:hypothetical protein